MALAEGVGSKWAVGLDGKGYMITTLDQESPFEYRAFTQQAVPIKIPRIDTSPEPGEASLGDLWVRSQHDWTGGRGQRVFDGENSDRHMSDVIHGFDPFTEESEGDLVSGPNIQVITAHNSQGIKWMSHGDYVYGFYSTTLYRYKEDLTNETRTITPLSPYVHQKGVIYHNYTSDGIHLYWSTNSGIYSIEVDDAWGSWVATETKINNLTLLSVLKFGKGRLIACKDNKVHVIDDLGTVTSGAAAHYNHIDENWEWTDAEEMGQGFYLSGKSEAESKLYLMSFDTTDASAGLTIGIPREVWRAPSGEKILTIVDYAGSAMLIGTTKGIRNVVIIDRDGNVVVGPLIETVNKEQETWWYDNSPYNIVIKGKYAIFPYKREEPLLGKTSTFAKMDLSTFAFTGYCYGDISRSATSWSICFPPWARDTDAPWWCAEDGQYANQTWCHKDGSQYVALFRTGEIRWGSLVKKEPRVLSLTQTPGSIMTPYRISMASPSISSNFGATTSWALRMSLEDWTPTSDKILAMQGETGDYHWKITLKTDSKLEISYLDDSDTVRTYTSTVALPSSNWDIEVPVWIVIQNQYSYWTFSYYLPDRSEEIPVYEDLIQLGSTVSKTAAPENFKDGTYKAKTIYAFYDYTYPIQVYQNLFNFDIYCTGIYSADPTDRDLAFQPSLDGSITVLDNGRYDNLYWTLSSVPQGPFIFVYYKLDGKEPERPMHQLADANTARTEYEFPFPEGISFSSIELALYITRGNSALLPTIKDWRCSVEPIPTPRYYRYYVPIMLYDQMTTLDGHRISKPGYAFEYLGYLETLYRNGTSFDFQKPSGFHEPTESTKVRIEEMEFKSFSPPKGAAGFGGIALVVLKEIAYDTV